METRLEIVTLGTVRPVNGSHPISTADPVSRGTFIRVVAFARVRLRDTGLRAIVITGTIVPANGLVVPLRMVAIVARFGMTPSVSALAPLANPPALRPTPATLGTHRHATG
jgi:hypothetical protein